MANNTVPESLNLNEKQKLLLDIFEEQYSIKKQLDDKNIELKLSNDKYLILEKKCINLESTNVTLTKNLDHQIEMVENQKNELKDFSQKNKDLQERLNQTIQEFLREKVQLRHQIEKERTEKEKNKADLLNRINKVAELKKIAALMAKTNENLKKEKNQLKIDIEEKEKQHQAEKSQLNQEIRSRQRQTSEMCQKIKEFETRKIALATEYNEKICMKDRKISELEETVSSLVNARDNFQFECKNEKNSKMQYESENSKLLQQIEQLNAENNGLKIEIFEAKKQQSYAQEVVNLNIEISKLISEKNLHEKMIVEQKFLYDQKIECLEKEMGEKLDYELGEKKRAIQKCEKEINFLNNNVEILLTLKKEQDEHLAKLCLAKETMSGKDKLYYEYKFKELEIQMEHIKKNEKIVMKAQETQTDDTQHNPEASDEGIPRAFDCYRDARTESTESENGDGHNNSGLIETETMQKLRDENTVLKTILRRLLYWFGSKKCMNCANQPAILKNEIKNEEKPHASSSFSPPIFESTHHHRHDSFQPFPLYKSMQEACLHPHALPCQMPINQTPPRSELESRGQKRSPTAYEPSEIQDVFKPPTMKFFCGKMNEKFSRFISNMDTIK